MEDILIKNCKFRYECDQDWSNMKKTNDAYIRHCGFCKKDVHLVSENSELEAAIENNWCMAVRHNLSVDFELTIGEPTSTDFNLSD